MYQARRADLIAVGLIAAGVLAGVLAWPSLPDQVAIHWNGGSPDSYVAKPVAVLGIPAFGAATVAFTRVAPDSLTNTPAGGDATVLFLGVVFAWVEGIVVLWNLGWHFSVEVAIAPVLLLAGLLVAYEMGVFRPW